MPTGQGLAAASNLDRVVILWVCQRSTSLVEKQGFSRHFFQHLHLLRYSNPCEEQSPHLGFVIIVKKKKNSQQPSIENCSLLYPWFNVCDVLQVMVDFFLFVSLILLEVAEKEKDKKKNIPFVDPSAGVQEFQRWSFDWSTSLINWSTKRHSRHYEWSSDSEGRMAPQTR